MITHFTIFGERNSGTNYLQSHLSDRLYLKFTNDYGFKHWYINNIYPRGVKNTTTDNECLKSIHSNTDHVLFIIIVRNPHDWIGGMYNKPWHIKNIDKSNYYNFVSNKYIAYENNNSNRKIWNININNKYPYFIEEDENLISLRNTKNEHFYNLKNHVQNYYLIRQEHFKQDINDMINIFHLKTKHSKFKNYKTPTNYKLDTKTIKFIDTNLNNTIDKLYYIK
jgi:hypothetical protein